MDNLFKDGKRGIRICLCLGLKYEAKIAVHVKDIAKQVYGDVKEIKELCEKLVYAGYLIRDAGAAKSYRLRIPPSQIPLGEIIKICEPNFYITDCKISSTCNVRELCYFDRKLWGALTLKILEMLNQLTIQNYLDNMYEVGNVAPLNCHLSQLADD